MLRREPRRGEQLAVALMSREKESVAGEYGGVDETRTRDLLRDRQAF
jgi:hypothetical protein